MIKLKNISKRFETKDKEITALDDVNIHIKKGDIYGIIGMSGAGKSTLVRTINCLTKPSEGEVVVEDTVINHLSNKELREVRRDIAMIFQHFNLLMQKNCLQNVAFPLKIVGYKKEEAEKRALELLEVVGLKDKAKNYPAELSGGQKQRVAIARALTTNPKVLLCDEATSALDPKTTRSILNLIEEINEKLGITVVIITHQMSVVKRICHNVAILEDGKIVEDGKVADVFTNPQSEVGRRFVFPDRYEEL